MHSSSRILLACGILLPLVLATCDHASSLNQPPDQRSSLPAAGSAFPDSHITGFSYWCYAPLLDDPGAKLPLLPPRGPAVSLMIMRDGKVRYTYATQPDTGGGGESIVKEWQVPPQEAARLLDGLVADGLLDIPDTGAGKGYHFSVSCGRWGFSAMPASMPAPIIARLRPYLDEGYSYMKKKYGE